jgi:hypothetical protein
MVCRSIAYETTLGVQSEILLAPTKNVGRTKIASHSLTDYTVAATVAATTAATSITIDVTAQTNSETGQAVAVPATSVTLDAGSNLKFGLGTLASPYVYATLANSVTIAPGTPQVATLESPLTAPIAANAITKTKALLALPCRVANVNPTIKAVETTNYLSGTGMENVVTGNSKKVNLEIDLALGSPAHNLIRLVAYDDDFVGREVYLRIVYPSGETHEGYALLTSMSATNNVQDKRSITMEAAFQGQCYKFTPPDPIL